MLGNKIHRTVWRAERCRGVEKSGSSYYVIDAWNIVCCAVRRAVVRRGGIGRST